jgi:hypothetical protein
MLVSLLDPGQHNRRRQIMKFISNALTLFILIALAVMVFHDKPKQQAASDLSERDLFCMVQNVYHEERRKAVLAYMPTNAVGVKAKASIGSPMAAGGTAKAS